MKQCGAIPSPRDERDYLYSNIMAGTSPLPPSYVTPYLSELAEKAINQGTSLMCVPCAVSHLKYLIERKQNGNGEMFSPGYLYGNKAEDDADEGGCYPRCVVSQAAKFGVCHKEEFPKLYQSKMLANKEYKADKERLDGLAYPYRGNTYYACGQNVDVIKHAIYDRGGVVACYCVYDSFYVPDWGMIKYKPSTINYGYHEVLLCGWDDEKESFIMLNSWGKIYPDIYGGNLMQPYCYINYTYPPIETHTLVDDINEIGDGKMFKDIENHWAKNDIEKVVKKGIMNGFPDETFRPDEPLTRAQLCSILVRLGLIE